jgi:hypothetical protein
MATTSSANLSPTSSANNSGSESLTEKVKNVLQKKPVAMALFAAVAVCVSILLFNNKPVYRFTNNNLKDLIGTTMDEEKDCPSDRGLIIHSLVAALVASVIVYLLHDSFLEKVKKIKYKFINLYLIQINFIFFIFSNIYFSFRF